MSVTQLVAAHGTVEVSRGSAYFHIHIVNRRGLRALLTEKPGAAGEDIPFFAMLCQTALRSTGVVVIRGSADLGWKRKSDVMLAATELVRILGGTPEKEPEEDSGLEDREEGVRIWFNWNQLEVLSRVVEEGVMMLRGPEVGSAALEAIEAKLDVARRSIMARRASR